MKYLEFKFQVTPAIPGIDILTADLADVGFDSFMEEDGALLAYVPEDVFSNEQMMALPIMNHTDFKVSFEHKAMEDTNWNAVWESQFDPVWVDKDLLIKAPFHEEEHHFEVVISPQMSFGTGHHETTYLMAKYMLNNKPNGLKVLDMGTGTGVLAILAKKLGAAEVVGIDIEDNAVENAQENQLLNNISSIYFVAGSKEKIVQENYYQQVWANINRNILLDQLATYAKALTNNGELYLSGFFESDIDTLVNEAKKCGFSLMETQNRNEWAALKLSIQK